MVGTANVARYRPVKAAGRLVGTRLAIGGAIMPRCEGRITSKAGRKYHSLLQP